MNQMQGYIIEELFGMVKGSCEVAVTFFEIYAGRCLDLLNDKNVLNILEDKSNNIQIHQRILKEIYALKNEIILNH